MSENLTRQEMAPETFRAGLDRAFAGEPPVPSAETYEARGRRRLGRRWALAVSACALAVAAVPVSVAVATSALDDAGDDRPVVAAEPEVPDGWRVVSAGGASFAVPPDWVSGSLSQWCVGKEGVSPPIVSLPSEMASTAVDCMSPTYWYGAELTWSDKVAPGLTASPVEYDAPAVGNATYPDGSWVAQVGLHKGWSLLVVTDSEKLAEQVLASLSQD